MIISEKNTLRSFVILLVFLRDFIWNLNRINNIYINIDYVYISLMLSINKESKFELW